VDLESRPVPLPDNDHLTRAGQRWGEGLASILPYLVKSLRGKPRAVPPSVPPEDAEHRG
jgi:hypothetical protein